MSDYAVNEIVNKAETAMVDLANLILIRQGKRRKIVTGDYVLFDRKYYFDTYGLEDGADDMDAGSNSDRDCVSVGTVGEDE